LRKHPDFLQEYPDLLEMLSIPHASGAASSLIERQVKQLRAVNQDLNRQLNRLMHVASENEKLMTRLHQLTLELMGINEPSAFFRHLSHSLKEDFKADIIRIFLFDRDLANNSARGVRWLDPDDEQLQLFQAHLDKGQSLCGRLNENKLSFLFEDKSQWVKSTALVPIGKAGCDGMMAIGSSDPARFYPGMGTLFLDLLADVISGSLSNSQPEEHRKTA
jgi:uncharacterized protein YigA (DUF484 family)